ncbi:peroxide stress protein YaaA [Nocardioides insulae]|uniref:peroxide stress protein YaaA n=1 Tax=Nocardioides insulae TaxID=394734 RepID=UPI00041A1933|nr:peroxide stress protein YaaA [Nocardioides insulae]
MLILLPPSEGKAAPTRGARLDLAALTMPGLTDARAEVIDALRTLCQGDPVRASAALGVPASQPELVELNAHLRERATARADRIYTGVLYDALDAASLSSAAKRRLTRRVRVASSVFGLVSPADRIPAYRLSGDTRLPGLGMAQGERVSSYWRRHLGPAAEEALGEGLLIDLRSGTYAAFWKPDAALGGRVATVRVLHETDGRRSVVSHFNKATKGRITRALLEDGATPRTPTELADALRDLGWYVEAGAPGRAGTQLDVVVAEL